MHVFHCREYTGYMALHIADTGPPGAAWAFTDEWRLQQVTPDMVRTDMDIYKVSKKKWYLVEKRP